MIKIFQKILFSRTSPAVIFSFRYYWFNARAERPARAPSAILREADSGREWSERASRDS